MVKYPHCTPITPSQRTKLWIDAATVRATGVPYLVKYPHCTPITLSRRTNLWKDAAPVPDLTLPRPEQGTEKNEKTKELDLQTSLLSSTQETPTHPSHRQNRKVRTLISKTQQNIIQTAACKFSGCVTRVTISDAALGKTFSRSVRDIGASSCSNTDFRRS